MRAHGRECGAEQDQDRIRVRTGANRPEVGDDHKAPPVGGSGRRVTWAALGGWYWAELGRKVGRLRAEKESGAGSK
jgi:hypothetical protein